MCRAPNLYLHSLVEHSYPRDCYVHLWAVSNIELLIATYYFKCYFTNNSDKTHNDNVRIYKGKFGNKNPP